MIPQPDKRKYVKESKGKEKLEDDYIENDTTSPKKKLRNKLEQNKALKDLRGTIEEIKKEKQQNNILGESSSSLYTEHRQALLLHKDLDHPSWAIIEAIKILIKEHIALENMLNEVILDGLVEIFEEDVVRQTNDDIREVIKEIKTPCIDLNVLD